MGKFNASKDPAAFDKAIKFLDSSKDSFGILLDYQKLRINA